MKRFHAAGICDCCDPPECVCGEINTRHCPVHAENPNYGPGNPDWERDFERSEGRLSPAPFSTPRQGGRN